MGQSTHRTRPTSANIRDLNKIIKAADISAGMATFAVWLRELGRAFFF
jgi:hypothetical protein